MRYLFSNLIDEEIKRDCDFRSELLKSRTNAEGRPMNIQIPEIPLNGWNDAVSGPTSNTTLRPTNGVHHPMTPGLAIGLATPGAPPQSAGRGSQRNPMTPGYDDGSQLEMAPTNHSQAGNSLDYFSNIPSGNGNGKTQAPTDTPAEPAADQVPQSPTTEETPKKSKALFSKKFNMSFNMKKFGAASTPLEAPKPPTVDEKSEDSDSKSSKTDEKVFEDNFYGAIQKIRHGYEEQANMGAATINSMITPSLPNDTPLLNIPSSTTILIQEDRPDSGGVADLFEGKVGTLALQVDLIEKSAPTWLADVLLRVRISPHPLIIQSLTSVIRTKSRSRKS